MAEFACWAAGAALLAIELGSGLLAQYGHATSLSAFDAARTAQVKSEPARTATVRRGLGYAEPDQSLWAPARVRQYEEQGWLAATMPEAVIRIPRLRFEVPVFEGTTEVNMTRGAGRIPGSARRCGTAGCIDADARRGRGARAGATARAWAAARPRDREQAATAPPPPTDR
jgi:hypothetical protein